MFGKRVIRLGDPTTHGGQVLSASGTFDICGKPVARIGDTVMCPMKGHGVVTIVEGDPTWTIDGRNVALEGHKCSCGCSLISTLPNLHRSYEGDGQASMGARTQSASAVAAGNGSSPRSTERYDEHFILRDQITSDAVRGFVYGIETSFGEHHDDIYDDGATAKAYSESAVPVNLLYAMQKEIGLR